MKVAHCATVQVACCSHFYSTHPGGKMKITAVALCALLFLVAITEGKHHDLILHVVKTHTCGTLTVTV